MTLIDYLNLALIGFAAIICVLKGFKVRVFKRLASIASVVLACFVGNKYSQHNHCNQNHKQIPVCCNIFNHIFHPIIAL